MMRNVQNGGKLYAVTHSTKLTRVRNMSTVQISSISVFTEQRVVAEMALYNPTGHKNVLVFLRLKS